MNTCNTNDLDEETIVMYNFLPALYSMYALSQTLLVKLFLTVPYDSIEDEIHNFKTKSDVIFLLWLFLPSIKESLIAHSSSIAMNTMNYLKICFMNPISSNILRKTS